MRTTFLGCCALVALILALILSRAAVMADDSQAKQAAGAPPAQAVSKITISRETTYITEPLRPDGHPDYVAALNKRLSEGVTPENNAAVLMLEAIGPSELDIPELAERTYQALGIKLLPVEGKYLIPQEEIVKRWKAEHPAPQVPNDEGDNPDQALWDQFEQAQQRPWSAEEFPLVAQWLAANERPLELAVEASNRSRFYWPVITGDQSSGLIAALLPVVQESRELACLLVARAMQKTKQGDTDGAWQDLLACHRLARLVAQGWTLVEVLVGFAIDGTAVSGDCALAHYGQPSADQIKKMRADLRAMPPFPAVIDKIDQGERLVFLDSALEVAREGPAALQTLSSMAAFLPEGDARAEARNLWSGEIDNESIIDWDVPLRMGNQWYDRLVAAAKTPDRKERAAQIADYQNELQGMCGQVNTPGSLVRGFFTSRTAAEFASPRIGAVLVCLLLPAVEASLVAEERTRLVIQMEDVALALAAYRANTEQYPAKLEELVPKYLPKIPIDTFSPDDAPIRYRREADAYILWSVGRNHVDDGGKNEGYDDFVLRPVPPEKSDTEGTSRAD